MVASKMFTTIHRQIQLFTVITGKGEAHVPPKIKSDFCFYTFT